MYLLTCVYRQHEYRFHYALIVDVTSDFQTLMLAGIDNSSITFDRDMVVDALTVSRGDSAANHIDW